MIDVLWLARDSTDVAAAFEVEHTTSIYSRIVRLLDLALGAPRVRLLPYSELEANCHTMARFGQGTAVPCFLEETGAIGISVLKT